MKKVILTSALLGSILLFSGCGILDTTGNKDCYNEDCSDNALTREHNRRIMSKKKAKAMQKQQNQDSEDSGVSVKEGLETTKDIMDTIRDVKRTFRGY